MLYQVVEGNHFRACKAISVFIPGIIQGLWSQFTGISIGHIGLRQVCTGKSVEMEYISATKTIKQTLVDIKDSNVLRSSEKKLENPLRVHILDD